MKVLLLGATGNLGLRLLPALLAHNHTVVAFIRNKAKLLTLISPRLANSITIHIGDALDTASVETALREHGCDALVNTAGNFAPPWKEQYLGKIATSVSSAAVRVGRDRGKLLRAWIIGGIPSLVYPYPGNVEGWTVNDFMPQFAPQHHRGTEEAIKKVDVGELEWSLLCVAWMWPISREIDILQAPRGNDLLLKIGEMPAWRGTWVGNVPVIGRTLDFFWCINEYSTKLDDVADLIAEDLASGEKRFVGCMVGMKERGKVKGA